MLPYARFRGLNAFQLPLQLCQRHCRVTVASYLTIMPSSFHVKFQSFMVRMVLKLNIFILYCHHPWLFYGSAIAVGYSFPWLVLGACIEYVIIPQRSLHWGLAGTPNVILLLAMRIWNQIECNCHRPLVKCWVFLSWKIEGSCSWCWNSHCMLPCMRDSAWSLVETNLVWYSCEQNTVCSVCVENSTFVFGNWVTFLSLYLQSLCGSDKVNY